MNIVPEHLSAAQPLAEAFLSHFDKVQDLYGPDANKRESWAARADWLDNTEFKRIDRSALVRCLRLYNKQHNDFQEVSKSLDLLEQPGTLVISGGQQSGIFTGPLLVIYKAVTIIQSAREASSLLERPVVPLFWIAGEDHDWDEVNHTYFLSRNLQISKLKMDHPGGARSSVSYTLLNQESWKEAVRQMCDLLPDSEFKPSLIDLLTRASIESESLSDCFAKIMGQLFGRFGLVLLDSADPNLRTIETSVFERIISQNDELEQAYHASAKAVLDKGYPLQADVAEGGANLFYIHEGARILLFKQNSKFTDRRGIVSFTRDELLGLLQEHPERFSNNVLTRPLMQESLLPVLGTVLGTGEIAYWSLTRKAFHVLGLEMPIIVPRMSFTMVEGTIHKHMVKYKLSFQDVQHHFEEKRQSWLASQDKISIDEQFAKVQKMFEEQYDAIIEQLGSIQAGLTKLGENNKGKIVEQIHYLQHKAQDALAKQNEAGLRQLDRIYHSLFPLGKPQERVYNVFYYLNRYGYSFIDLLMEIPYHFSGNHQAVYL
ncbi:bacillithiol biosynthesis cysteine-adding enzyme BshC [Paenibacillus sediminis]|uniref:Putative cysteine ligase BshC n=1 Tax=Paenibacillus sediminis TaxID=664909 RepID=A0ABS4GYV0_9BACL|nr:bacillithiol biosynthesis cysteine-adding enzyme BshC [Paenibacillus sediminis]MBP1935443.1 bacillithiol biosynthesis cysteine-adding enzyme BshC [Paenibacillus sediminis]